MPLQAYLKTLAHSLQAGHATEHTHRPALQTLLQALAPGVTVVNEPRRIACGAPDLLVARAGLTLGYVETKDVGAALDAVERSEQLARYRRSLENLLLTDYLEFRWYVDGAPRGSARIARLGPDGKLLKDKAGAQAALDLLGDFLAHAPQEINTPRELAGRMARLTHLIRDVIVQTFESGRASNLLQGWRSAFARVLVADLDQPDKIAEFADMFAQTLAYGLFSARVMDLTPGFDRQEAQKLIPRTNPFLREFFYQITGPQLDDEPYVSFVDDLAALLAHTDMAGVLADFGKRTRQQDPVVHFYETFLAAYDPALREMRGVYYTPEPVVSYIVRSVDHLLKTRFGCPGGLADTATVTIPNTDPSHTLKGKREMRKTAESHKVLILDPAAGTGTFLYAVVDHIRQGFMQRGDAGMWSGYVRHHLLPRLFGFELLMAPYAVAHFKLALQLAAYDLDEAQRARWAYDFGGDERVGVYLTNALEGPHEFTGLPLFTQFLADETQAANRIKQDLPIMVVLGNPPYSGHSANKGDWIAGLLKGRLPDGEKTPSYYEVDGQPLGERNPKWLQDDYVKFIRFGQWRIQRSGAGILAFVTNHGYLDNPTFRGMRQALMHAFSQIYLLDLHSNAKKKETAPDGSRDDNVFDIQQGVAIGLFVKEPGTSGPARVYHADLWGTRERKYERLFAEDVAATDWEELKPQSPFYLFIPRDVDLLAEYQRGWKVTEVMPVNVLGFQTHRDHFAIAFDRTEIEERIALMREKSLSDAEFREQFNVRDNRDWQLANARKQLRANPDWQKAIIQCSYRPFDRRWCYFSSMAMDYPRRELLDHVAWQHNLCLNVVRQTKMTDWQHAVVSRTPTPAIFVEIKDGSTVFPLYLYPDAENVIEKTQSSLFEPPAGSKPAGGLARRPNLSPAFIAELETRLGLTFKPDLAGFENLPGLFGPEDVFHYTYAVLHSPTYRARYAEFLKIDFPRLPLTSDVGLFRRLCGLGRELAALHLLESPAVAQLVTRYPAPGDNRVERGYPRYQDPPGSRVYINPTQYFEGVSPAVWAFQVGGYQVLDKWLKDRRGRQLFYDDLTHYQKIVAALQETMRLMAEIDAAIPAWPLE
jgi:hypothetical protein